MAAQLERAPREAGFSLVEVLIAVAILGIVALGIVGLFTHSMVVNASGYDYALLSRVASQTLEQMQALPFDDPVLDVTAAGASSSWPDPTGTGRFSVTYTVAEFLVTQWADVTGAGPWPAPVPPEQANLKQITVGVESETRQLPGNRRLVVTALRAR